MFLAKVTGNVVSTQKVASMVGRKLLTVEPFRVDPDGAGRLVSTGRTFVAVDTVGAGDAFAAAFLHGLGAGWPTPKVADFANRVGALVASRRGAIPDWTIAEANAFGTTIGRMETA